MTPETLESRDAAVGIRRQPGSTPWIATWAAASAFGPARARADVEPDEVVLARGHSRALGLGRIGGHALPSWAEDAAGGAVFDGWLYNGPELEGLLPVRPSARGDAAAIVLAAYRAWGHESLLSRLKGIFALVLWDAERDVLLAVRDPLGAFPLLYAEHAGAMHFSTTVGALVDSGRVPGTVNRVTVAEYLAHRPRSIEDTLYEGVRRVPPGHSLRVGDGTRHVERYWNPLPAGTDIRWIPADEVDRFDALFEQAVARCMIPGSAAVYLSGGLDSTSIAAIATDRSSERGLETPVALSMVFPPPADEASVQTRVARTLGLPQVIAPFEELIGPDGVLATNMAIGRSWPAPIVNPWLPAFQELARRARARGYRIVLSGDGGDEMLAVSPFQAADALLRLNVGAVVEQCRIAYRSYRLKPWQMGAFLWRFGIRPIPFTLGRRILRAAAPGALLARWRRQEDRRSPPWFAPDQALRRTLDERRDAAMRRDMSDHGTQGFYVDSIRDLLGSAARCAGLEETFESGQRLGIQERQPFWDADLVDFLLRVPPEALSVNGRSKGLVRRTVARRFPDLGFEQQRKVMFTTYFRDLLLREGHAARERLGGFSALVDLGIVDQAKLDAGLRALFAGERQDQIIYMWDLFNVEAWLKAHV